MNNHRGNHEGSLKFHSKQGPQGGPKSFEASSKDGRAKRSKEAKGQRSSQVAGSNQSTHRGDGRNSRFTFIKINDQHRPKEDGQLAANSLIGRKSKT